VKREEFLVMYKYIILFCAQQILFLKICRLFQPWVCLVLSLASCLAWMGKMPCLARLAVPRGLFGSFVRMSKISWQSVW